MTFWMARPWVLDLREGTDMNEMLKNAKAAKASVSLLSTEQKNAALLAIQMLAIEDAALAAKLDDSRRKGAEKVLAKNAEIEAKYNV